MPASRDPKVGSLDNSMPSSTGAPLPPPPPGSRGGGVPLPPPPHSGGGAAALPPPPGGTSGQPGGKGGLGIALGRDQHKQISVSGLQPGMPAAIDGRIKVCAFFHRIDPVSRVCAHKHPPGCGRTMEMCFLTMRDSKLLLLAQRVIDMSTFYSRGMCC